MMTDANIEAAAAAAADSDLPCDEEREETARDRAERLGKPRRPATG